LYSIHKKKTFFEKLIQHITSGPVVAIVVEGEDVVTVTRNLIGATDPKKALPGTIRGDYSESTDKINEREFSALNLYEMHACDYNIFENRRTSSEV